MECHEIIDDLERECMQAHGIHLVIHYDPVVTDDPELAKKYASLLYDQAVLIAGFPLEDPSAYTDLVCELLMK